MSSSGTADGQQTLDGSETVDPRVERVARALWAADAKRSWGQDGHGPDGQSVWRENAKRGWPRVARYYIDEARVALTAADGA